MWSYFQGGAFFQSILNFVEFDKYNEKLILCDVQSYEYHCKYSRKGS